MYEVSLVTNDLASHHFIIQISLENQIFCISEPPADKCLALVVMICVLSLSKVMTSIVLFFQDSGISKCLTALGPGATNRNLV